MSHLQLVARRESPLPLTAAEESLLRQVRMLLSLARHAAPINLEAARAFEARAANKLQRVVGVR